MDILDFGSEDTAARLTLDYEEVTMLMSACAGLREARYPGVMDKLPQMFDEDDLARAVGSEEGATALMSLIEMEQSLHQALHMFPGGHEH